MMNRLAGFVVGVMSLAFATFSDGALAATECNTGPPPNPPLSGTVAGGVVVNAGDFCVLGGANVSGGVQVNDGGILIVCGSVINGGFIANGAANLIFGAEEIDCAGNVINGAVQITNTGPGVLSPAPSIALERSTINGGVHLTGNSGPIAVASNSIAGGLFCSKNGFDLDNEGLSNVITGAIRCKFGD
ncbi:MAG TPA: hypothetical protein VKU81_03120 [Casimicrobiaceae bacterium]|nr:hypothetical protein [Casimicrobiaceae bacterium]